MNTIMLFLIAIVSLLILELSILKILELKEKGRILYLSLKVVTAFSLMGLIIPVVALCYLGVEELYLKFMLTFLAFLLTIAGGISFFRIGNALLEEGNVKYIIPYVIILLFDGFIIYWVA